MSYSTQHHSFSIWERQSWLDGVDFAVVGAGITGLSTAIELQEARPKAKVMVLERGMLPSGASTKNAGFACFGSPSELVADMATQPKEAVIRLALERHEGLRILLGRLGADRIGYAQTGSFDLFRRDDAARYAASMEMLPFLNEALAEIGLGLYRAADGRIPEFGFAGIAHLIENRAEGRIDTGRMMRALAAKAQALGVELLTGAAVQRIEPQDAGLHIQLPEGAIACRKAVLAVNGFARQFLPEADLKPARAQVLVTEPLGKVPFDGVFHLEEGYYYFRPVGDRILLGGGRHLALEKEFTAEGGVTEEIQGALEGLLANCILPGRSSAVAMRWSGTMGVGSRKAPLIERVNPDLVAVLRFGGMGVALGSWAAKKAATLALED